MNRNYVFCKYHRRARKLHKSLHFAHFVAHTKSISELYLCKRMIIQSILLTSKSKDTNSERIISARSERNKDKEILSKELDGEDYFEEEMIDRKEKKEITSRRMDKRRKKNLEIGTTRKEKIQSIDDKSIKVWVDGACSNNGLPHAQAGYGVYFEGESDERNISERLIGDKQTNQRAELMACISAIEKVIATEISIQDVSLKIYSDSKYVIDGITIWAHNWKKLDWNVDKFNLDLWKWLYRLVYEGANNLKIDWIKVKGHAGIHGNEWADCLARAGANLPKRIEAE